MSRRRSIIKYQELQIRSARVSKNPTAEPQIPNVRPSQISTRRGMAWSLLETLGLRTADRLGGLTLAIFGNCWQMNIRNVFLLEISKQTWLAEREKARQSGQMLNRLAIAPSKDIHIFS
jgi:hypothetical protein